jgi:hypothetical protein
LLASVNKILEHAPALGTLPKEDWGDLMWNFHSAAISGSGLESKVARAGDNLSAWYSMAGRVKRSLHVPQPAAVATATRSAPRWATKAGVMSIIGILLALTVLGFVWAPTGRSRLKWISTSITMLANTWAWAKYGADVRWFDKTVPAPAALSPPPAEEVLEDDSSSEDERVSEDAKEEEQIAANMMRSELQYLKDEVSKLRNESSSSNLRPSGIPEGTEWQTPLPPPSEAPPDVLLNAMHSFAQGVQDQGPLSQTAARMQAEQGRGPEQPAMGVASHYAPFH